MSDSHTDVVIAGAGPNGLMLAGELALAGVRPVIVDRLPEPSGEQKANALVGQVVRALDIRGLFGRFSGSHGPPEPVPTHVFAGMPLQLSAVPDNPMYVLPISQPLLVRMLVEWVQSLGVAIDWGHEVIDIDVSGDLVDVVMRTANGTRGVCTRYLVAADGGRSVIRRGLDIGFPGVTTPMVSRLAHINVPDQQRRAGGWDVPGAGRIEPGVNRFDNGDIFYIEREPGRPFIGSIEFDTAPVDDEVPVTLEEVRHSVQRILGVGVDLTAPPGPGPHALRRMNGQNTRQAERYRVGNVLLLGDSAHVHPPIGGPGLNLGLQDAMNLGWKLAATVNGWAPDGLLNTYHAERHPVGERLMMHSLSQLTLLRPGPEITSLRSLIGELLETPAAAQHLAYVLAGSDVRYDIADQHPLSGRFLPELTLGDGMRVAELLHRARPVLLDLTGGRAAAAMTGWEDRIDVVASTIPGSTISALLVRPDGYIAWCSETYDAGDEQRLREAANRWFGLPKPAVSSDAGNGIGSSTARALNKDEAGQF